MPSIQSYYKHHIASVQGNLRRRGDRYLAGIDVVQLVDYYYDRYKLPEIVLVDGGQPKVIPDEPSSSRKATELVPVTIRFDVETADRIELVLNLDKYKDNAEISAGVRSDANGFFIKPSFAAHNAKELLEKYTEMVLDIVRRKNDEVRRENAKFREQVEKMITERKSRLKIQSDMIEKLSQVIPLVRKAEPSSPVVPLVKKKQIVINPPQPRVAMNPRIDARILNAIIDVLFKGGQTFERAPETFAKLDEEDLRNILISFLNGNFELHAVAEAFNKLGKTDISLRYSGNSLLVAECKYWRGVEAYRNAIEQLFTYLTWRENIGVLITFVRERDFTSIIRKSREAASSHSTFVVSSLKEKASSYFVTKHLFPEDEEKHLEIHHLLFTIYS